jgi:hypothetical protein
MDDANWHYRFVCCGIGDSDRPMDFSERRCQPRIVGGHLAHLIHWLHEETEQGGIFAAVGIVIGLFVGYMSKRPIMHPSDACVDYGAGRDLLGHCPDLLDVERLISVLTLGVIFGFVAILIGWLVTGREPGE